ncbi:protein DGCR6-like [Ptychodera flava]|uniref:protein DGCR6-like n=1 Tax=Ptychodera flava TaxID=63121 RepID=UPI00396A9F98
MDLDPSLVASVNEEIARKERLQKRHYFMLSELQNMARDLPGHFQQRIPYDMLSLLASSLLDETVFAILKNLEEIQQMTEKTLHEKRMRVINAHTTAKQELAKKHKDAIEACRNRPHHLPVVKATFDREKRALEQQIEEETKLMHQRLILELDQKVSEQQVTLERAGVAGFYVTNNPQEVRLQMYLLDMMMKISKADLPPL